MQETQSGLLSAGIDIGSTSAKTIVLNEQGDIVWRLLCPTGWSSVETAEKIRQQLVERGFDPAEKPVVATGYGRVAVPYASKAVTEITCHGKGATWLFGTEPLTVIDIGGQDTKLIQVTDGTVNDFLMNDKCSAGTGRFLEVMANTLGMTLGDLMTLSLKGSGTSISSMCTVFAESEVISLIGRGEPRENIAFAVVDSIVKKVVSQVSRFDYHRTKVCLTGGLCEAEALKTRLEKALGTTVHTSPDARFAGAIGAALIGGKRRK